MIELRKDGRARWAEEINYWQTSRTAPDNWLAKAKAEIVRVGGTVVAEGFVSDQAQSTYLLAFTIDGDHFRMAWPVLQPKSGNVKAARIQAATALYHEVKAACVKAKFLGTRTAFFAFLSLPDGRTAADMPIADVRALLPGGNDAR
jgi:hypothetical protein